MPAAVFFTVIPPFEASQKTLWIDVYTPSASVQAGKLSRQEAAAAQEAAHKAAEAQQQQQAAQAEHLQQANCQLTSELQKAQVGWCLLPIPATTVLGIGAGTGRGLCVTSRAGRLLAGPQCLSTGCCLRQSLGMLVALPLQPHDLEALGLFLAA